MALPGADAPPLAGDDVLEDFPQQFTPLRRVCNAGKRPFPVQAGGDKGRPLFFPGFEHPPLVMALRRVIIQLADV